MPEDDGTVDSERVEQGDRVGGEYRGPETARRPLGAAVAALAGRDDAEGGRQVPHQRRERVQGVAVAVEHQDGDAVGVTALGVLQADAGGQRDGAVRRIMVASGEGWWTTAPSVAGPSSGIGRSAHLPRPARGGDPSGDGGQQVVLVGEQRDGCATETPSFA